MRLDSRPLGWLMYPSSLTFLKQAILPSVAQVDTASALAPRRHLPPPRSVPRCSGSGRTAEALTAREGRTGAPWRVEASKAGLREAGRMAWPGSSRSGLLGLGP